MSYMIVDEMHHEHPELIKDQYWDSIVPADDLPYTEENLREQHPQPSTANIEIPKRVFTSSLFNGLSSTAKVDEMVGKSALSINNYKFPEIDVEVSPFKIHFCMSSDKIKCTFYHTLAYRICILNSSFSENRNGFNKYFYEVPFMLIVDYS